MQFKVISTSGDIKEHIKEFNSLEHLIEWANDKGYELVLKSLGDLPVLEIYDDYRE